MREREENRIGERDREGESEDGQEKIRGMKRDRRRVSSIFLALSKCPAFTVPLSLHSPALFFSTSHLCSLSLSLINIHIFFILNLLYKGDDEVMESDEERQE